MDVVETQVQRTSPILRVTTDISELKPREQKYDARASETSRSGRSGESNLRHASSLLQKKKQLRPIYSSPNPYRSSSYYATSAYTIHPNSKSNVSAFTQRIMSAKLLRVKQLQNELKETQVQLHEAINENRVLKTLQKRQDNALKKYDGDQAQLPQLIKSHNEELRVITTQYKQLKASNRELELKLRQRNSEFENLKEQYRHLIKLSRDKHLGHRERLTKQVEDLTEIVKEQNDRIQMLTRRCELESKNYKHQLNTEMVHHKDTQAELAMAHATIDSLKNLIEAKDKYINNTVPNRFYKQTTGHIMCADNTRFRNLPKSTSSIMVHGKQESEETMNTTSLEQNGQDTDVTSDMSSGNRTVKNSQKIQIEPNNLNLRKRLTSRKLRTKNTNRSNVQLEPENEEENENDAETHYSSSFPSVDNSSKYNTSESDTVTRISSTIKGRRRVSIDSAHTVISDNFTNNEDEDDDDEDNIIKSKDGDKNKTKDENNYNNKSNNIKKDRNRRNSMSNYESDGPLESISESLAKAKAKDKLQRQHSIKDELKELEERLKNNNRKYSLEEPEESFDKLLERKTQSVKDELKEFETRLLNQNDLNSYSDSISKTFEEKADEVVRKMTAGLDLLPNNVDEDYGDEDCVDSDDESKLRKKFGFKDVTSSWNEMREKYQRERENTESLLDDYYKKMMINDTEETNDKNDTNESDLRLGEDEKEKLLKALKDIDRQTLGRKDSTDSETKERRNSLNYKFDYTASENHNVNSSYDFEFPSLQNINNIDDAEYSPKFDDDFVKSKAEVMEEIFGSAYKNAQETTSNDLGKS